MQKQQITPLKNFSEFQKEHSLSEELPFWDFFDDCVTLSDGTLIQGLKLEGLSIESKSKEKINSITLALRSFLSGLNDNTEISFFIDIHSNYTKLLMEHEELKSQKTSINELSKDRIKMLQGEIKKENILKRDIYLFIYKRPKTENFKHISIFNFLAPPGNLWVKSSPKWSFLGFFKGILPFHFRAFWDILLL